jgi:hypothetical protein
MFLPMMPSEPRLFWRLTNRFSFSIAKEYRLLHQFANQRVDDFPAPVAS